MDNYRQEIIFSKNEINNSLKNKSIKNNLTIPFQFKIPIKYNFFYFNLLLHFHH